MDETINTDGMGKDKSQSTTSILFWILLSVVCCVVGVLYFYFREFGSKFPHAPEVWGQFGDFVGGILNPFFGFFSFIALLVTLLTQRKELAISLKELKKSTEALVQQSKALDLQNFERTFFELIRLHHELVNGIVDHEIRHNFFSDGVPSEHIKHEGRECFSRFYQSLTSKYRNVMDGGLDQSKSTQEHIEASYGSFIHHEQSSLGHYFRNLYHIFKFIDERDIKNKQWYANIVRAQLSSHELCLLFYNALMPQNRKFKILIEKYAVLENMNAELLLEKELHMPLYLDVAYGERGE